MIKKLIHKLWHSSLVQIPVGWSKRIVIPGFDGLSIYDVLSFFIEGMQKNSLTTRASSLAFRFFLALFPSIIFLFALIPFIPINNFQEELLFIIKSLLPENAYEMANTTINELIMNKNDSLLSFGFLFALYMASNGINSMLIAFNESYHSINEGSWIKTRLRSLLILFILLFLVIIAIGSVVFSQNILDFFVGHEYLNNDIILYIVKAIKFIVLLFIYFLCFSSIYYFGNIRSDKFRFMSAGSTLATLLSMLISTGFAYYVNNLSTYNKVYGSIGTLIVIMLWLYFNSLVLLIGYELNASIKHAQKIKSKNEN